MEYFDAISTQLQSYEKHWIPFLPALVAMSLASMVIVVSLSTKYKLFFQVSVFLTSFVASITYLYSKTKKLQPLLKAFNLLGDDLKFTLSVVVICITYFVGGMYFDVNNSEELLNVSPAAADSSVTFTVPAKLPVNDKDLFLETFDKLCAEIIADLKPIYEMPDEAIRYIEKMLQYTVAGGKMTRGLTAMNVQSKLAAAKGQKLTNKERIQGAALGWCIEFLQAFFLVADDIMDASVTRRGSPCWYKLEHVQMIAINDSFILESCVYKILKKYFGSETYYPQLLDLFIEVTRQTEFGQLLDLTSQPLGENADLDRFTIERYTSIVKYKTAFYTFYLPVALGMICSGVTDIGLYNKAREILVIMGEYFQIQDDYLDCYGKPEEIGKVGTDIQDNKCSWLVVQALNFANSSQKKILEKNYGKHDMKCVDAVKKLYLDLNIPSIFAKYEEESYVRIKNVMASMKGMPIEIFEFLLSKTYKRSK